MDCYFNEISVMPFCKDKAGVIFRIECFIKTIRKAKEYGFENLKVGHNFYSEELSSDLSIRDIIFDGSISRTSRDFLLSVCKMPYIGEEQDDIEDGFILNDYYFMDDNYTNQLVEGLAVAFLNDSLSISLKSCSSWDKSPVEILDQSGKKEYVINASSEKMIQNQENWIFEHIEPELPECNLAPKEKHISLRNDHGKDLLKSFAQRLVQSPYVIEIINSLPFNPKQRNFIKDYYDNGLIEIVLTDTDEGYGLVVKSTATNIVEAKLISEILREQYG